MSGRALVTGAAGKVGRYVAGELARRGVPVTAATRSEPASAFTGDVTTVALDWWDESTWEAALDGVDRAFLLSPSGIAEPDAALVPFIDRALASGVTRFAHMGAMGIEYGPEVGMRRTERYLEDASAEAVLLRPNWFDQNFSEGIFHQGIVQQGRITAPAGDAQLSFVDTRDIGAVAAAVLAEDGHDGAAYTLTGPEALDHEDVAETISKVSGREVAYEPTTPEDFREFLLSLGWEAGYADALIGLFETVRAGYAAPVTDHVERVLGRPAGDFPTFAADHASVWT